MMRRLLAVALVLGLLLALVGTVSAEAKTRTVRCDEGADLGGAIEQAASGDTIVVKGVCRGEFAVIGKKVTLKGRGSIDGSLLVIGPKGRAILRDLSVVAGASAGEEGPEAIVPTRDVVVATQPIPAGDTIEPTLVSTRSVPLDETNEMALGDPRMAHGAIAMIDILPNQLITPNVLQDGAVQTDPMEGFGSPMPPPEG